MRERITIEVQKIFRPEAARSSAIDAVGKGELHPEYVIRHFGTSALLELDRELTTHFLQSYVHNDSFRQLFLSDLGIMPQKKRRGHLLMPRPAMIPWIAAIKNALVLENANKETKLKETGLFGLRGWKGATIFFSQFIYPEATDSMIQLLDNPISIPANEWDPGIPPISETVVGTIKQYPITRLGISRVWQGVLTPNYWTPDETFEAEKLEQVYPAVEPVTVGALVALQVIASRYPQHREKIDHAIARHKTLPTTYSVFVLGKEIPGTRLPIRGILR